MDEELCPKHVWDFYNKLKFLKKKKNWLRIQENDVSLTSVSLLWPFDSHLRGTRSKYFVGIESIFGTNF